MSAPEFIAPQALPATLGVAESLDRFDHEPGFRCRVAVWADTLPEDDLDALVQHLAPGKVKPLYNFLRSEGHKLPYSSTTWERHWTGRCPCTREA